jgi:hypothetical protein
MNAMRVLGFVAVFAVVLGWGISEVSQAETVDLQVGASLANMIWQQSPPAFAPSTAWSNIGLSTVVNGVALEIGVAFWDFHTMQISDPPSFLLSASSEIDRWSGAGVEIVGGATLTPNPMWLGLHIGARLRAMLYEDLIVSSSVFLAGTQGVSEFPAGWAFGVSVGVSWSWPLPFDVGM